MRLIKLAIFLLFITACQTVILPRLNIFGVIPDLFTVSLIIFAVLQPREPATFFAAASGLIQDILLAGFYINLIVKVLISNLVSSIREEFVGDEKMLAVGLVALISAGLVCVYQGYWLFVLQAGFGPLHFLFQLIASPLLNMIFVPLLYPIIKRIVDGT